MFSPTVSLPPASPLRPGHLINSACLYCKHQAAVSTALCLNDSLSRPVLTTPPPPPAPQSTASLSLTMALPRNISRRRGFPRQRQAKPPKLTNFRILRIIAIYFLSTFQHRNDRTMFRTHFSLYICIYGCTLYFSFSRIFPWFD